MKISVIVPYRNEKRHIGRFLDSLLTQDLDPGWDLEIDDSFPGFDRRAVSLSLAGSRSGRPT